MKILFESAEPFLAELSREAKDGHVWRKQVRFEVMSLPEQAERISFRVGLVLGALIDVSHDDQYFLEAVIDCGSDDPDVDPKDLGSRNATANMKSVYEAAEQAGLTVLPGRLQE